MIRAALSLILLAASANAATFTAKRTGNLNDGATFGLNSPGVAGTDFPNNNDHLVITSTQVVTVPTGFTWTAGSITLVGGTAATPTTFIVNNTTVTLSSTVIMGVTGSNNVAIKLTSGTYFNMAGYNAVMGAGGASVNGLAFLGNSSGRVTVFGGGGAFTQGIQGGFDNLTSTWTMVDFSSMGTMGLSYCTTGSGFVMSSSTYVNSRRIQVPQDQTTPCDNHYIEYSDFRTPQDSIVIRFRSTNNGKKATGRNDFSNNTVSSDTTTGSGPQIEVDGSSIDFRNNVFKNINIQMATSNGYSGVYSNNFFASTTTTSGITQLTVVGVTTFTGLYSYTESDNPHNWTWNSVAGIGSTRTIIGNVIEVNTQGALTDNGDLVLEPVQNTTTGTIANNILIGTRQGSVLLSLQGAAAWTSWSSMENNTVFFASTTTLQTHDCFRFGENYGGRTAMWLDIQNNYCVFGSSDTNAFIIRDQNPGAATDKCTTCDYNNNWNVAGIKYQITRSTAAGYGVHDVQADPTFCDNTRNLTKWDTSLGGNGTPGNAVNQMLLQNNYQGTYNSAYNVTALIKYIQDGFAPQSWTAVRSGGNGLDMGAVPARPPYGFFGSGL